jgi:hypothetical protein
MHRRSSRPSSRLPAARRFGNTTFSFSSLPGPHRPIHGGTGRSRRQRALESYRRRLERTRTTRGGNVLPVWSSRGNASAMPMASLRSPETDLKPPDGRGMSSRPKPTVASTQFGVHRWRRIAHCRRAPTLNTHRFVSSAPSRMPRTDWKPHRLDAGAFRYLDGLDRAARGARRTEARPPRHGSAVPKRHATAHGDAGESDAYTSGIAELDPIPQPRK